MINDVGSVFRDPFITPLLTVPVLFVYGLHGREQGTEQAYLRVPQNWRASRAEVPGRCASVSHRST